MAMLSQEQNGNKALRTPKVVKEFKAFVLRGNVVDLAVGVVMGAAFATVVGSLVKNVITPVTGVFGKLPKFEDLSVPVGRSELVYGAFINDLLSFLIVGMVVFFFVVKPLNRLLAVTQDCPECLSSIPKGARRCMYCGEAVPSLVTDSAEGSRQ